MALPAGFPGRPAIVARLLRAAATGGLGQAYLLVGPEGAGKEATALETARLLQCPRAPGCAGPDLCESCRKAVTFQHPDVRWIGPAPAGITESEVAALLAAKAAQPFHQPPFAASAEVTIGAPDAPGPLTVRALLRFLRLAPFQGARKIAVVADAHRLTAEAANALLKTLEEPPPAALLLLLTSNRAALPSTLVSRCQSIRFDPYAEDELVALLSELGEPATRAQAAARMADGNARRAAALGGPLAAALGAWAGQLCETVHAGGADEVQLAAEMLHKGIVPAPPDPDTGGEGADAPPPAADLAARRDLAIQLCEMLNLYYSELLACRERDQQWRPRIPAAAGRLRALSARRSSRGLVRDIARIESAKGQIDGNLNIGLVAAVLLRELIENAREDQSPARR